jgi:hypothetical protein
MAKRVLVVERAAVVPAGWELLDLRRLYLCRTRKFQWPQLLL